MIASLFLKFFTSGTLGFVSDVLKSLTSEHVAILQAQTGLAAAEANAVINAERDRQASVASLMSQMMGHPVWWIAWGLFVFPPGLYTALIHIKSIACPFYETACKWNIPEVPPVQESWDHYVILSMFGIFAASSVVSLIASRIASPK